MFVSSFCWCGASSYRLVGHEPIQNRQACTLPSDLRSRLALLWNHILRHSRNIWGEHEAILQLPLHTTHDLTNNSSSRVYMVLSSSNSIYKLPPFAESIWLNMVSPKQLHWPRWQLWLAIITDFYDLIWLKAWPFFSESVRVETHTIYVSE